MKLCVNCGAEAKTVDTRLTDDNITRRRRECLNCETRFTTYEFGEDQLDDLIIKKIHDKKAVFRRRVTALVDDMFGG